MVLVFEILLLPRYRQWAGASAVLVFFLAACSADRLPLPDQDKVPQPTFLSVDVTPAPESPTATPWPFEGTNGVRAIPDGLDPEFFSPAEPDEVIDLWSDLLVGSVTSVTSNRLYFRGASRFAGDLHMCPGGVGYLDGDPSGDADWSVRSSVGEWYEVSYTHEIPGRLESVIFVLSIRDGKPVRSGSTEALEFVESDFCSITDPALERPSFTVEERRLDERMEITQILIDEIPWVAGERQFPAELSVGNNVESNNIAGADYWNAYLSGGVVDAVAYDYGTFVLTEAFSGSIHMCEGRVAVLEGTPSGIGEWAVHSSGSSSREAKILFTLPGDRTLRTLALGVGPNGPVLMGRNDSTGLIAPSPLGLRQSTECG